MARPVSICTVEGCERPRKGRGLCSMHYQRAKYHDELDALESPTTHCEQCGVTLTSIKWGSRFCSGRCADRARYDRTLRQARQHETCDQCGVQLVGRSDKRFCSVRCGKNWRNARTAERLLDEKADRPPCRGCGAEVPVDRSSKAQFCSDECKIRSRRQEAYGLTRDELTALLAQHGVCAICGTEDWGRKGPQVDHCHNSGKVRGVLCANCNNGLGRFADDPKRLRAAARYVEAHASD